MNPEYRQLRIEHAQRYLEEVRDLAVKHRATDAYIRSLYEDAEGIGGIDYSRILVSQMPNLDKVPNSVAVLVDMKRDAEADAEGYFELKRDARRRLDEMGGMHANLLMLRYLSALPWVTVAEAMNYSEDWCKHVLPDALCDFYDYLPFTCKLPEQRAI